MVLNYRQRVTNQNKKQVDNTRPSTRNYSATNRNYNPTTRNYSGTYRQNVTRGDLGANYASEMYDPNAPDADRFTNELDYYQNLYDVLSNQVGLGQLGSEYNLDKWGDWFSNTANTANLVEGQARQDPSKLDYYNQQYNTLRGSLGTSLDQAQKWVDAYSDYGFLTDYEGASAYEQMSNMLGLNSYNDYISRTSELMQGYQSEYQQYLDYMSDLYGDDRPDEQQSVYDRYGDFDRGLYDYAVSEMSANYQNTLDQLLGAYSNPDAVAGGEFQNLVNEARSLLGTNAQSILSQAYGAKQNVEDIQGKYDALVAELTGQRLEEKEAMEAIKAEEEANALRNQQLLASSSAGDWQQTLGYSVEELLERLGLTRGYESLLGKQANKTKGEES